jgi:Domain of unknown function (DUF397)
MERLDGISWRKSSFSGNGGNCVEVGTGVPGKIAIRDTKRREDGVHVVTCEAFAALLDDIRAGNLDL